MKWSLILYVPLDCRRSQSTRKVFCDCSWGCNRHVGSQEYDPDAGEDIGIVECRSRKCCHRTDQTARRDYGERHATRIRGQRLWPHEPPIHRVGWRKDYQCNQCCFVQVIPLTTLDI
ncbi:acetoin reductase [Moniliophthora roreri]|nr:acetoin reductase [Moniliophthora roreri]